MRIGLLARSGVSVSAFVDEGDRLIARLQPVGGVGPDSNGECRDPGSGACEAL